MARSVLLTPKWLVGHALALVVVVSFTQLGVWQLRRHAERQTRDAEVTAAMEDYGYTVVRFSHTDNWSMIISKYPYIFGSQA